MTLTPFDTALAAMAAPLPESSGSMIRTLAPWVMSASACVCIVAALPCALSILNCVKPAPWNALVRYGASKETYRVDVVVSGSSTPTRPFPLVARSFSWAIAEKSLVNDVAEIPPPDPPVVAAPPAGVAPPAVVAAAAAVVAPPPDDVVADELPELSLPQAARPAAIAT